MCCRLCVDLTARRCAFGSRTFAEGDVISVAGDTGDIHAGQVRVVAEKPVALLAEVRRWRDAHGGALPA